MQGSVSARATVAAWIFAAVLPLALPRIAAALPDADTLLADLGASPDEIQQVHAGQIVTRSVSGSTDREIAASFAFEVSVSPAELAKQLEAGLLATVDPNTISRGVIRGGLVDFAALTLTPDGESRRKRYLDAGPGDSMNLSTQEIAMLSAVASPDAVDAAVRQQLFARWQAYSSQGLDGIAAYDRGNGRLRSAGEELRAATDASRGLAKYAPRFFALLKNYPAGKTDAVDDQFAWTQFDAHGVPTLALVHAMFVRDGDAVVVSQRQFYVSEGFNSEQAVAAFLPVNGGTVVVYENRTSTDQVTGFGGSAKRSIGSRLLASQLEGLFAKLQQH